MGNREDEAHKERTPKICLLDGNLAGRRENAKCPLGELREDGCRGGLAEGQEDEGGGDPC